MKRSAMKRSIKPMKKSRLNPRSKKMDKFYKEVRIPAVIQAVGDGKRPCPVKSQVCTHYVQGIHEVLSRGRAGGIIVAHKPGNIIGTCHACNSYISSHPQWAKDNGWLVSNSEVTNDNEQTKPT